MSGALLTPTFPGRSGPRPAPPVPPYVELAATSNFSFLHGASHPEDQVRQAHALGHRGIGIADRNTLAGVVRAHSMAKTLDFPLAIGARLVFCDGTPDILAYPIDRPAYGRLCRLLTTGNMRAEKGDCRLTRADLLDFQEGLCLAVLPPRRPPDTFTTFLSQLKEAAPDRLWLAAALAHGGDDARRLARLADLARRARLPVLAVGDALYHAPEQRPLHDILTCIRTHVTLDAAGTRLAPNAERHLKPPAEMARLFRALPEAVAESLAFFSRLDFSLDQLKPTYPREARDGFASPQAALEALAWTGARTRYPEGIPDKVRTTLAHELGLIAELGYAPYFLTVDEIVRFARGAGILCQGRGSAANSAVCFCLGLTEVDPMKSALLFERFISRNRNEPPDIDIDFEHERRGEVLQFVYQRYGAAHAGLAATTITYRTRSAVREVGKVLGLSEDTVGALAGSIWGWSSGGVKAEEAVRLGLDPTDRRLGLTLELSRALIGFPRHLSQHVGGMVVTHDRLDETVPLTRSAMDERPIIEWNKDDLEAVGLLKVDVLALGMLTAIQKCFALLNTRYGQDFKRICDIPPDDKRVYAMLQRADSIGVFQVESRAQQTMLPRLKPTKFEDLVVEVAIVRPGPIQGGMVHPYLRRKQGLDKVVYPSPELKEVLEGTLGVPLFQEQAMQIAIVGAGFTAEEADKLRRAMATFKHVGTIDTFKGKLIRGMLAKGYERAFAESLWQQIQGFGSYGFPRSHAESFALLVYVSAWIKCHYPDVFAAGLLNAWPMGFYAPAQLVRDAAEHGVEIRPVDINSSHWDHTLEAEDGAAALSAPPAEAVDHELSLLKAMPPLSRLRGRAGEGEEGGRAESELPGGREGAPVSRPQSPHSRPAARPCPEAACPLPDLPPQAGEGASQLAQEQGRRTPAAGRLHPRHGDMAGDVATTHALRLGLRQIEGLHEEAGRRIAALRGPGYDCVRDLWLRTGLSPAVLERLADADAFRSLGLDRRAALWAVRGLRRAGDKDDLPLFRAASAAREESVREAEVALPVLPPGAQVIADYRHLKLSLKSHPLAFLRPRLTQRGVTPNGRLPGLASGRRLTLAGLVLVRQRPGTASGVIFMTIEDEQAFANVIVWPRVFETFRPQVMGARLVGVTGRLQNESSVIHLVAEKIEDWSHLIDELDRDGSPINPAMPPDEAKRGPGRDPRDPKEAPHRRHPAPLVPANAPALPKGRNFH
ncbi:error-prone DNA polymerase [Roseixanthobacter glucoisosaccharinicivorans]|uniref:error-prone DNA polymerase n=1 Tax=Roseixanthobacter glucoisosaccharinicivorans TaxID=3119923 RepID=UPI00372CAF95